MSSAGGRRVTVHGRNDSTVLRYSFLQVHNADGWPDKICVQCVHQVSRCHAFKAKAEKADIQLRQYIKGITVIVEPITQIELQSHQLQRANIQTHQLTRAEVVSSSARPLAPASK